MQKDYYKLKGSDEVLIAEAGVLYALLAMGRMDLISGIYKKIYTTPGIYAECLSSLSIDALKVFRQKVFQMDFPAGKTAIASILDQSEILTEDDGYAMLCGMVTKMDVIMDDPRKSRMFSTHSVHVVRLSDILTAAALTRN